MKKLRLFPYILLLTAALFVGRPACACSLIDGIVDYNCDGVLKIAVTGDSIVRGLKDPEKTSKSGGYVLRIQEQLPDAQVINMGVPGINSLQLLSGLMHGSLRGLQVSKSLAGVDYILIQVGSNDYWAGFQPQATVRNIGRIKAYLEQYVAEHSGLAPIVMVATPPKTARLVQRYFITYLEDLLTLPSTAKELNVVVRFDRLGTDILSFDQIHPSGAGYTKMARMVMKVFKGWLNRKAAELQPQA